jgi:diguanylate cyclase (GGDEF)-like protein/PAS domain S-box-containing protein
VFGVIRDMTEAEACRVFIDRGNDVVVQTDLSGRITYLSPSVTALTGYEPEEQLGRTIGEIAGEAAAAALAASLRASIDPAGPAPAPVEYEFLHKEGRLLWLESRPRVLLDPLSGEHVGFSDVVRDVSQRKAAEAEREFANIVLKSQIDASPVAMMLVDPSRKSSWLNRMYATMWGIPPEDIVEGRHGAVYERCLSLVRNKTLFAARVEYLNSHVEENATDILELIDGRIIERYGAGVHSPQGSYLGRVWYFRDVTEHRQALARALHMARFDGLTSLPNRSVFVEALKQAVARVGRGGTGFAVLYLNLDDFKDINIARGHAVGDELLQAVGGRLRASLRKADVVARFGGDEFAILVEDPGDVSAVAALAETLIKTIEEPFSIGGAEIRTSAGIGIDMHLAGAADAESLLSHADLALYRAKAQGRGCYRFFTEAMDTDARERVSLAAELRDAIASDQLFLMYQPQMDLSDGTIAGVEALVRWRHPTRGVLGPELFVPLAEDMGLIDKLGRWVLRTACRQAADWREAGAPTLRMCVNLSALQFMSPLNLEADIDGALSESGLPPEWLELELTETVLMTAAREHGDLLGRLGRAGVTISIDDFGTGYSSLDYLRRFPADRIKIAQTFVTQLQPVGGDAAIVKATLGLARELGIKVIAEGVETKAQYDLLKCWGCAEAQGYYFAVPLEASQVLSMLLQAPASPDRAAK